MREIKTRIMQAIDTIEEVLIEKIDILTDKLDGVIDTVEEKIVDKVDNE